MEPKELLEKLSVRIVYADSFGAKSYTVYLETKCGGILIDPGAAAMHPSYPLDHGEKRRLRREALRAIAGFVEKTRLIIITHYHYDHYVRPWDGDYPGPNPYIGRKVIAKNPNQYINESQRARAEELWLRVMREVGLDEEHVLEQPAEVDVPDPEELMPKAAKATGERRLKAGREWFKKLICKWRSWRRFPERVEASNLDIMFVDTFSFEYCGVSVQLLGPHFHGDIYERTGWVIPVLIERGGWRILYTSDLTGPLAEDYVDEIISLKPHIVIADGPATYLPPYMFAKRDLERVVENMLRILREVNPALIVWDHHLVRECGWRSKVEPVFREAEKLGVQVKTVSEVYGKTPLIDMLCEARRLAK